MDDLETEIKRAIRLIRFGQVEPAIEVLENLLKPEEEEMDKEYPKWMEHEGKTAVANSAEHEAQIREGWGLNKKPEVKSEDKPAAKPDVKPSEKK